MDENLPKPWSPLAFDLNDDGAFTLTDLRIWFAELYFMPGDWLLWFLAAKLPAVAGFLDLGAGDYGGSVSGVVSACAWFLLAIGMLLAYHAVRTLNDLITNHCRNAYAELLRRTRLSLRLLKPRFQNRGRAGKTVETIVIEDEVRLEPQELNMLGTLMHVEPPYALSLSEAAQSVAMGRRETRAVLERLTKLKLAARATSGSEGENAYMLTQAGRALGMFNKLGERSRG